MTLILDHVKLKGPLRDLRCGAGSQTHVSETQKISGPELSIWDSFLLKKMKIELGDVIKGGSQVREEKAQVLPGELPL